MTHDNDRVGAIHVAFRRQNEAADGGLHAEHREIIPSDVMRHDTICVAVDAQAIEPGAICERIRKYPRRLFANVAVIGVGENGRRKTALLLQRQDCEPARIFNRQRAQHHHVDHAENHGVDADAEGQRQDRNRGKSRSFAESAHGVANVLDQRFKPLQAASVAICFGGLGEAAELDERGSAGFFGGHAAREVGLGFHFDVRAELVIEVAVEPVGSGQRADTREKDAMPRHGVLRVSDSTQD